MKTIKFIKNGKELDENNYNSKGDMIEDCDYIQVEETMTKQKVIDRFEDILKKENIKEDQKL